jgi:Mg2+ and Co2+ transporter CorA
MPSPLVEAQESSPIASEELRRRNKSQEVLSENSVGISSWDDLRRLQHQNAHFWCTDHMLASDSIIPRETVDHLLAGDANAWTDFDITLQNITRIFDRVQMHFSRTAAESREVGGEGEKEQIISAALQENTIGVCPQALPILLRHYGLQSWGEITLSSFASMFRRLKLAQLFRAADLEVDDQRGRIHILDFAPFQVHHLWPLPTASVRDWFFEHRTSRSENLSEWQGMRWVHMHGLDALMLLRLAVKYHLHPLSIEDALLMSKQPAKIERTGNDYFCAVNLLQLVTDPRPGAFKRSTTFRKPPAGDKTDQTDKADEPPPVSIRVSFISMFVFRTHVLAHQIASAQPHLDMTASRDGLEEPPTDHEQPALCYTNTIITIFEDDPAELGEDRAIPLKAARSQRRFRNKWPSAHGFDTSSAEDSTATRTAKARNIFESIKQEILLSSTRLHAYKPEQLMHAVLDKTVDELDPICAAYGARLDFFQKLAPQTLYERLEEVQRIKLEARDVYRTVRPLMGIIKVSDELNPGPQTLNPES